MIAVSASTRSGAPLSDSTTSAPHPARQHRCLDYAAVPATCQAMPAIRWPDGVMGRRSRAVSVSSRVALPSLGRALLHHPRPRAGHHQLSSPRVDRSHAPCEIGDPPTVVSVSLPPPADYTVPPNADADHRPPHDLVVPSISSRG